MLSARLRRLVDSGLIEPRLYQEKPPRHEYFLTEKGLDLWPVLVSLIHWGDKYYPQPEGRPIVLLHKGCGGEIDNRRTCTRCGDPVTVRDVKAIAGSQRREANAVAGGV